MANPRFSNHVKEQLTALGKQAINFSKKIRPCINFFKKIGNINNDTIVSLFFSPNNFRPWDLSFTHTFGSLGPYSGARQEYYLLSWNKTHC